MNYLQLIIENFVNQIKTKGVSEIQGFSGLSSCFSAKKLRVKFQKAKVQAFFLILAKLNLDLHGITFRKNCLGHRRL